MTARRAGYFDRAFAAASGVRGARGASRRREVAARVWGAAALLVAEGLFLGLRFDTESLSRLGGHWWTAAIEHASVVMPLAMAIATATILFGADRLRAEMRRMSAELANVPPAWPFIIGHVVVFAGFVRITARVLEGDVAAAPGLWVTAWLATGIVAVSMLLAATIPRRAILPLAGATATTLLAAAAVGVGAWGAGLMTERLWYPLRHGTLWLVDVLVGTFASDPVLDVDGFVVGTERFRVQIAPGCSGYEGIGLVCVFLAAYIALFRREMRFPQALLLVPLGTAAVWLANALRITALIAIGTWISPDVAFGGFHSYSGALLFCGVALSLAAVARRSSFFARGAASATAAVENPTVPYLMPFLAIIATTMVTGALSADGTLGVLYPLRVLVPGALLWHYRRRYGAIRRTASWPAVAIGAATFILWIGLDESLAGVARSGAAAGPGALALSGAWEWAWVAFRVFGAVVTVPIAEELAFRGYVLRRLVSPEFQEVSLRRFSWAAFVLSSVLFGVMHDRPLAGAIAGMAYALAARRRGELADAVVAHATTNALLAVYVLATGSWSLWR